MNPAQVEDATVFRDNVMLPDLPVWRTDAGVPIQARGFLPRVVLDKVELQAESGDKFDGMRFKTANGTPAAGQAICQLDRLAANGDG